MVAAAPKIPALRATTERRPLDAGVAFKAFCIASFEVVSLYLFAAEVAKELIVLISDLASLPISEALPTKLRKARWRLRASASALPFSWLAFKLAKLFVATLQDL